VRYKQGQLVLSVLWPQSLKRDFCIGPFREPLDSQSLTVSRKGEQLVVSMAKQRKAKWEELTKTLGEYSSLKHEAHSRSVTPGKPKSETRRPEPSPRDLPAGPNQPAPLAPQKPDAQLSPKSPHASGRTGPKSSKAYLDQGRPSLEASPVRDPKPQTPNPNSASPLRRLSLDKESSALRLSKNLRLLNEKEKPNYRSGTGLAGAISRKSTEDLIPIKKTASKTEKKPLLRPNPSTRSALNKKALASKPHSASPLQQRLPSLSARSPQKTPGHTLASKLSAKKLQPQTLQATQAKALAATASSPRPARKLPNPETSTDQSSERDWLGRLGSILAPAALRPLEAYASLPLDRKLALQRDLIRALAQAFKEELLHRYECEKRFERVLLGDSRRIGELEKRLETRKAK